MSTQLIFVTRIEFVSMSVPLTDLTCCIDSLGQRAGLELARVCAKSHRSSHRLDTDQITQLENNRMRSVIVEFGRVCPFKAANISRKLDSRALHTEANPEIGRLLTPRVADGPQHPGNAALTKAT